MDTNENQTSATNSAPNPAPTKLGSNQITTALVVIIVVLLFVMLMLSMNGHLFQKNNQPSADLTALETRNSQLRAEANAERARQGLPPLPADASNTRMMAQRIQRDANGLAALTTQWQSELETKDRDLRALQNQLTQRDANSKRLYAQIADLQSKLDASASASDQLVSLSNDLKMANNQIELYRKQSNELQRRPSNDQMVIMRKQLNESIASNGKLQIELDALILLSKEVVSRKVYDELLAELALIRPLYNKQRYTIQKLRALIDRTHLFIESEKDLPAYAARLFARLRTLENANEAQLLSAYQNIDTSLNAQIVHRQTFLKGSSQITFDREKMILDILNKRRDTNSFFLVVGYASKSGGSDANQKLSANRATTVASVVNALKATGQDVKAVYLGETARFSKTVEIENQICEVWEIKK